jgi:hypothetical protein
MNESGDLQRNVAAAAKQFSAAVSGAVGVVKTVDRVTGSLKHTLELLLALKIASKFSSIAENVGLIGTKAKRAEGEVATLRGSLGRLAGIGVITVEILIATKVLPEDFKFGEKVAKKLGLKPGFLSRALGIPTPGQGGQPTKAQAKAIEAGKRTGFFPPGTTFTFTGLGDVVVLDSSGRPIASSRPMTRQSRRVIARLQAKYGRIASKIKVRNTTTHADGGVAPRRSSS